MSKRGWFAAKTVYRWRPIENSESLFEERVVLFEAGSFEEAVARAEMEAQEYCADSPDKVYLGYVNVFRLFDDAVGDRVEVYSLVRESDLSDQEYLDHFYDTCKERTETLEE